MAEQTGTKTVDREKGKRPKKESIVWKFFDKEEGEKKARFVKCTLWQNIFKVAKQQVLNANHEHACPIKELSKNCRTSRQEPANNMPSKIRNIENINVKSNKCKTKITRGEIKVTDLLQKIDTQMMRKLGNKS